MEFFNPKMRRELEKKDEEIKRTTGLKGSAPGGDDWAYLTSFSRVPVSNIIENTISQQQHSSKIQFNYISNEKWRGGHCPAYLS